MFARLAFALALIGLLAPAAPVAARDLTDAEKADLTEAVTAFEAAMSEMDFEKILSVTPPRITAHIADQAGMPIDELRKMTITLMRDAMGQVEIEEMGMDMENATYTATPDGTPYALIPTRTVVKAGDMRVASETASLALYDDGAWRLIRVDEQQQIDILRSVYPSFAEVELPTGETKILE